MFELLSNAVLEASRNILATLGIFFVIPGALQCFFGYRLQKLLITVIGFLSGLVACSIGGFLATKLIGPALLLGLIGGVLLGFLSFRLYKLTLCLINTANAFLGSATLGFLLCFPGSLRELLGDPHMEGYYLEGIVGVSIIMALVIGLATIILLRPISILSTAFQGGMSLGLGLALMLYLLDVLSISLLILLCIILGTVFQFHNTRAEGLALKRARQAKAAAHRANAIKLPKRYYIKVYTLFILLEGIVLHLYVPGFGTIHPFLLFLMYLGTQRLVILPIMQAATYRDWKQFCPRQMAGVSRLEFMLHSTRKFITHPESTAPADTGTVPVGQESTVQL